jgi:hypothetical protein
MQLLFPSAGCICLLFQLAEVKVPQMWRRRIQGFRIGNKQCVSLCADGREWCYFTSSIREMWIYSQIGVAMLGLWATTAFCYSIWIVLLLWKLTVAKAVQQLWYLFWQLDYAFTKQCTSSLKWLPKQGYWRCRLCEIWTYVIEKVFGWAKWSDVKHKLCASAGTAGVLLGSVETAGGYRYLQSMKAAETLLETWCVLVWVTCLHQWA